MPALMVSLMAAGVVSALLGWLLSRRVHSADNGEFRHAFVAAEGRRNDSAGIQLFNQLFGADQSNSSDGAGTPMFGLAFSSVAVHTVPLTTPFVMSVFAYLLACMWVRDQTCGRIDSLPTPRQYGHLVDLFGSSGLSSLYDTAQYLSIRHKEKPAPPMSLVAAFCAVLVALLLNFSLSLPDLSLHMTATTFSFEFTTPIAPGFVMAAGSAVNTTLCAEPVPFLNPPGRTYSNCQHSQPNPSDGDMFWGTASLVDEGAAVLGNTSISSQIQMFGNLAILLPKTLPSGVQNLLFSTLAMKATWALGPLLCMAERGHPGKSRLLVRNFP
ncbi:hypothetical protein B0H13DRAFT_1856208 [Mycena leptocephala]|nr:hypothetical protein B0H13DRAFT_1856208 [Mycena leptocephala]